jgi:hypothetical protein
MFAEKSMEIRSKMKVRILVAIAFFAVPGMSYLSADVYRWTDSSGTVHYGNRPPSDAGNIQLLFKETPPEPGSSAAQADQSSTEAIIQRMDEELRAEEEARRRAEEVTKHAPPNREELIGREKIKLEKKIEELEAQPLEYFGSQNNKRTRIGYYRYRLEALVKNPDDYFKNPEPFEGNIPAPAQKP